MTSSSDTSGADVLALICGIAMIVGFFLPWFSITLFGVSASISAWELLLRLLNAAGNSTINSNAPINIGGSLFLLIAILAASICGTLTALWGLRSPEGRRVASRWSLVAGLVGAAPLVYALIQMLSYQPPSALPISPLSFIGIGAWVTFVGAVGLIAQVFFPRPYLDAMAYRPADSCNYMNWRD